MVDIMRNGGLASIPELGIIIEHNNLLLENTNKITGNISKNMWNGLDKDCPHKIKLNQFKGKTDKADIETGQN